MARNKLKWFPVTDGTPYRIKKGSYTAGKTKGGDCVSSPIKKLLCKARSYKRPEYKRWMEVFPHCNE
jgi:hypothetical protein